MMKKTLLALSLLGLTGSAVASPFYVDTGTNWDGATTGTSDKVCDTCTSSKDEITYIYQSESTTVDTDGSGDLSAGDTINTKGGLAVGGFNLTGLGNNQVTGFNPSQSFGAFNDNGYGGSNWLLSFSFTGLTGTVVEYTPGVSLELAYGPYGNFDLYYTTDGITFSNFMDIKVTGAVTGSGGTLLAGVVDFTTVDALPVSMYNMFNSDGATCGGLTGFYDIWLNCDGIGLPLLEINFLADFNTNASTIQVTDNGAAGAILTGNHDGSAVFNVPEPSTLALFGGTLLLLGAGARRRKA